MHYDLSVNNKRVGRLSYEKLKQDINDIIGFNLMHKVILEITPVEDYHVPGSWSNTNRSFDSY